MHNDVSSSTLSERFLKVVYESHGDEKIKTCAQCGVCSGSCPTSYAMEYTPRKVIAMLRAGMLDKVLTSNTPWICASCYYCNVRCPNGINITDLMYALKRFGIEHVLHNKKYPGQVMSETFAKMVDNKGRIAEPILLTKFFLKTNPFGTLKMASLGMKLFMRGQLPLFTKKIKGVKDLTKMRKVEKK
ncbi:MAG: 4Fe-4S dicluster domain-containing protein [Candidatus Bathyarchaeota archaeon]